MGLFANAAGVAWRAVTIAAATAALAIAAVVWMLLPPRVSVATVTARDLAPVVQGVGTVEAKVIVHVASKIAGRIVSITADQGDRVEPGQRLVQLDDAQLAADVRRADAAVDALAAQLRDLEAGARPEEIAEARAQVVRARAQLDDLLAGSRPEEVEEIRARLLSATATRVLAARERERSEVLHEKGLIAAQDNDRARQAASVAEAQERALAQTLDLALAGARPHQVESARAQLRSTEDRLALLLAGPRPHQVSALRAQLGEARAARDLARERHRDATILSPFDAIVVSRELETGATVNPGTPILKVADPQTLWVTVHVDERESGHIAAGDRAGIVLGSLSSTSIPGRVVRLRRESDRVTEQVAVDIAFDEAPRRLTLGEQVEARIVTAGRRAAPAMPMAAVVRRPEGTGAMVVADGRLAFRRARLGIADAAGWIEVMDGLRAGETVVLAPGKLSAAANDGRRVRVLGTP
jgi:multidrug efflux pump subunit AcrA (membrane-fusion protein)